jgi:hypothetical protein
MLDRLSDPVNVGLAVLIVGVTDTDTVPVGEPDCLRVIMVRLTVGDIVENILSGNESVTVFVGVFEIRTKIVFVLDDAGV